MTILSPETRKTALDTYWFLLGGFDRAIQFGLKVFFLTLFVFALWLAFVVLGVSLLPPGIFEAVFRLFVYLLSFLLALMGANFVVYMVGFFRSPEVRRKWKEGKFTPYSEFLAFLGGLIRLFEKNTNDSQRQSS